MVSVQSRNSDDPSSNPTDVCSFSAKFVFEKNENKQKDTGVGPFKKIMKEHRWCARDLNLGRRI